MADTPASVLLDNLKVNIPDLSRLAAVPEFQRIDRTAGKILDQLPVMMLKMGIGVLVVIAGWLISGWVASQLNRLLLKAHVEETLAAFLGSTIRFVLFFTLFAAALTIMGVGSTSLAALLGTLGLAIGLALKGTLGHVASGMMLMVHRPIKVGDWVENTTTSGTPTVSGTVKRIGVFSTEVNTQEFVRVFIPNTLLWENILRNHTYNRMRMLKLTFGLGYEVDVRKAFEVVKAMLARNPLVLRSPEPVLAVESFEEAGVMCSMSIWSRTEDRGALKNTILLEVMEALRGQHIRMAYQGELGEGETPPAEMAPMEKDGKVASKAGVPAKKIQ